MIFDTLAHTALYQGLGPRFALAFEYLTRFDAATPDGRVTLDGEDVFALVQSYQTAPASTKQFESHRIYADVQYVAAGDELIYTATLDRLKVTVPYSASNDAALYSGPDDTPLRLRAGGFCVLWPQDGHKPCCQWDTPSAVKKVVVKVRV